MPQADWRPAGSRPLSDAQASTAVRRTPEIRPQNTQHNQYLPSSAEIGAFHSSRFETGGNAGVLGDDWVPQRRYVSGGFAGTTDEILQWASIKWGIPTDLLRAVAHTESTWHQSQMGDRRSGIDASGYPVHSRISATEVYESLGIMQIKWRADGSMHPGTEPLRWKSTAFNVDYWAAMIRFFYDGSAASWFRTQPAYVPGLAWESVGAWYSPTPWNNIGAQAYVARVTHRLAARAWEQPGF